MTKEEFAEGWKIFILGIGRNPSSENMKAMASSLYQTTFQNKDRKVFRQACINLAETGVDHFSPGKNLLQEIDNVTVEYQPDELVNITKSICHKCINGLIYYEDDLGYEYVAKCDCEKGINLKISTGDVDNPKPLPFFKNLPDAKFKRKNTTGEQKAVSDRECQELKNKMWEKLGRPDLVKPLPPPNTYDNSEFREVEKKIISSSKGEVSTLINMLGGEKEDEKEKERKENIEEKTPPEDDELPF